MGTAPGGQLDGVLACFLEFAAVFNEGGAQRAHGGVLLARVAVRHDDGAGHAVFTRGPADALAVVAPGGADHLARQGVCAGELVEVGQAAADLEGAHRRVVLVFDPAVGAQAFAEQRPAFMGCGWFCDLV